MGQAFPQLLLPCQPLDALHSAPVPEQPLEQSGPAQVGGQRRNSRHHLGAHQEESREGRKEGWREGAREGGRREGGGEREALVRELKPNKLGSMAIKLKTNKQTKNK